MKASDYLHAVRAKGDLMKYICFGYLDTKKWATLSVSEQNAAIDECFTYDEDVLRKNGHWVGGEGLQSPENATTLRYQNGRVWVTDGPYTETKEMLGGLLILEARDLDEAIQLLSRHPGVKMGPWEIRPVEDMTQVIHESERRRSATR
jgi:hypothetical protein